MLSSGACVTSKSFMGLWPPPAPNSDMATTSGDADQRERRFGTAQSVSSSLVPRRREAGRLGTRLRLTSVPLARLDMLDWPGAYYLPRLVSAKAWRPRNGEPLQWYSVRTSRLSSENRCVCEHLRLDHNSLLHMRARSSIKNHVGRTDWVHCLRTSHSPTLHRKYDLAVRAGPWLVFQFRFVATNRRLAVAIPGIGLDIDRLWVS